MVICDRRRYAAAVNKEDKIIELLMEIRDFQKQQVAEEEKLRKAKNRSTAVRVVLYAAAFTFAGYAAFHYYRTLTGILG